MPGRPSVEEVKKTLHEKQVLEDKKSPSNGIQAHNATVTVKISRVVRDYITKSSSLNEPIDRTLRRLLGLKVQPGVFAQRSPRETPKTPTSTTTIKVTAEVREFITSKANWNESIDQTLRRLLGLKQEGEPVQKRRSR